MWVNTRMMVLVLDVIRGPVGVTKSTLAPAYLFGYRRSDRLIIYRVSASISVFFSYVENPVIIVTLTSYLATSTAKDHRPSI